MKKVIILFLLSLLISRANSQTISADELVKTFNCRSFDCYNDFLINKNFIFDSSTVIKGSEWVLSSFSKDKKFSGQQAKHGEHFVFCLEKDGASLFLKLTTTNESLYKELYNRFKEIGFQQLSTETVNRGDKLWGIEGVETYYKSDRYSNMLLKIRVTDTKVRSSLIDEESKQRVSFRDYDIIIEVEE